MIPQPVEIRSIAGKGLSSLLLVLLAHSLFAQWNFETKFFKITIDNKGYITSMKNNLPTGASFGKEFSPTDKPSPLLCLYAFKKQVYYLPQSATYQAPNLQITYSNGIVATVEIQTNVKSNSYIKLKLTNLSERKDIDDIQWGPINTNITNILGEVIGVAKDTSDAVNYAIGMFSIDDNTDPGPSSMGDDDMGSMYVQVHSSDPHVPIPDGFKEGQRFPVSGSDDVAFYAKTTKYTKYVAGNAGEIDAQGRISFEYHATDKRKKRIIAVPYRPFESFEWGPVRDHIEVEPVPGKDCVGSTIAFYGAPEDRALKEVLEQVVINEGLMHLTTARNGSNVQKWIRDPARTVPGIVSTDEDDDCYQLIEYADKMGFCFIQLNGLDYVALDRAHDGVMSGTLYTTDGRKTYKEVGDIARLKDISLGLHTIANALQYDGSNMDVTPIPNKHLACFFKRTLVKGICSTDDKIEIDNPQYFNDRASADCDDTDLNFIKIENEIINFLGVSDSPPYILQKVVRGSCGTKAQAHPPGAEVCRLAVPVGGGYEGFMPDLELVKACGEAYADRAVNSGFSFCDFDGYLYNNGHGQYGFKQFYKAMHQRAKANGYSFIRCSSPTIRGGNWLYQTFANFGSEDHVFDSKTREWKAQGISMNNTALGNYFPSSFSGMVNGINENSTVQQFENLEAMAVGVNASYALHLNPHKVEDCPIKEEIFEAVKTWECARAANAFPREVLQKLRISTYSWHLEEVDADTWKLYRVNGDDSQTLFQDLKRDPAY